ncbi:MAG: transposase [Pseudomonadales bacterium]
MTNTRRAWKTYPKEFKPEALRLMEAPGKPASEVAMPLGIRRNQLYKWKEKMIKKGGKALRKGTVVKYTFIRAHRDEHAVTRLCDLLNLSTSGYYG